MKAVILAGGEGARLRPLTDKIPEALLPVLNTPVIDYPLAALKGFGLKDFAVTIRSMPEKIIGHLDASSYRDGIYYFFENSKAGDIAKFLDETFVVISGAVLTDIDFEKMLSFHRANRAEVTAAVTDSADCRNGALCADSLGRVFGFKEKPDAGRGADESVNTGVYIVEPHVLDILGANPQFEFGQRLFNTMLEKFMRVFAYRHTGYWREADSIGAYFKANMDVMCGAFDVSQIPSVTQGGSFTERDGARVFSGGNVYIGDNVKLSGNIILGGGAQVMSNASLKDCIVFSGAAVPAFSETGGCIAFEGGKIAAAGAEAVSAPDNIIPFALAVSAADGNAD